MAYTRRDTCAVARSVGSQGHAIATADTRMVNPKVRIGALGKGVIRYSDHEIGFPVESA